MGSSSSTSRRTDDRLREEDCRANVIHIAPIARDARRCAGAISRLEAVAALAAGLWFASETDKLYADALRRAATRFGAKIVQERVFEDTGGARRTDTGIVQIQQQIPLFTQSAPDYDVLVAADESEVFAGYLPYRTWDARPVAGSAGLVPTSWDAAHDQWGANQLQNRFVAMFSRRMTALDMPGLDRGPHDRRGGGAHAASADPEDDDRLISRARTSRSRRSRGRGSRCATGIFSCASRSCWPTGASSSRSRRRKASCTSIRSSTRWASIVRRPNVRLK